MQNAEAWNMIFLLKQPNFYTDSILQESDSQIGHLHDPRFFVKMSTIGLLWFVSILSTKTVLITRLMFSANFLNDIRQHKKEFKKKLNIQQKPYFKRQPDFF